MRAPIPATDAGLGLATKQVQEALPNVPPIQLKGFVLVAEAHQALIAGGVAVGVRIVARLVEVATREPLAGDPTERVCLLDQSTEYAGAALCCL